MLPSNEPPTHSDAAEPRTTADGTHTLYSAAYGQTYHSCHGALTEARHVFLEASGVAERLTQGLPTTLLEVGFGTGLNFLVTAHAAIVNNTPLHYVALERDVLAHELLARLNHGERLHAEALRDDLLTWRRSLPPTVPVGTYHTTFSATVELTLRVGDATVIELPSRSYHAVYLDAFSPDVNPELWSQDFFARLYEALSPGAALSTYSARGSVRRALQAAGFVVQKRPGPPGKREMVVAER